MFELSLTTRNFLFFDSDLLVRDPAVCRVIDPQGNGVKITMDAKKAVTRGLVHAVAWISARKTRSRATVPRGWVWPLRGPFNDMQLAARQVPRSSRCMT